MSTTDEFSDTFEAVDRVDPRRRREILGSIADLLTRNGIDVADIGRVHRVNVWEGFYKNDAGEAQKVEMTGVQLSPVWAEGPQWPVVAPAAPTVIRYSKARPQPVDGFVTVIVPDTQIGFLRLSSGAMIPMHDEEAMGCALEVIRVARPRRVVLLGDFLDLAEWSSKFLILPEFALTTQAAVDRGHRFLAEVKAAAGPDCDMVLLAGNHDDRLGKAVARNALAAMRLRQANLPESWPVLSIPFLLRLDELGVRYVGGYPAGRFKIADAHGRQAPLYAIHGQKVDVAKVSRFERQSFIQGHAHHVAHDTRTFDVDGVAVEVEAWSVGCLCRLDGTVPSTNGGHDEHGVPMVRHESWQHAVAVVTETGDGWDVNPVRIRDGRARFRDRTLAAAT